MLMNTRTSKCLKMFLIGILALLTGACDQIKDEEINQDEIQKVSVDSDEDSLQEELKIIYPTYKAFDEKEKSRVIREVNKHLDSLVEDRLRYNLYAPKPFQTFGSGEVEQYWYAYNGFDLFSISSEQSSGEPHMVRCETFYYHRSAANTVPEPYYMEAYLAEVIEGNIDPYGVDSESPYLKAYFHDGRLLALFKNDLEITDANELAAFQFIQLGRAFDWASNVTNSITVDFTGEYEYEKNSEEFTFSTHLSQEGDLVYGTYCGYTLSRVDCGMESQGGAPCEVRGTIKKDTLYAQFKSCYAGGEGNAKLYFKGDVLVWETTMYPEGFSTPPSLGILRKQ